jgi:hypothetical protein
MSNLARGVREGCLYRLLANLLELVNHSKSLGETSSLEEAYVVHA